MNGGKEEKIKIDRPVIVEGVYDKCALSSIIDATVITTGGFSVFNNREKQALIRALAKEKGVIILTDPDGGGKQIRSFITGMLPKEQIVQLYIPRIEGKEKRKKTPSRSGVIGVEGTDADTLRRIFAPFAVSAKANSEPVKKSDLYFDGLSGGEGSSDKRRELAEHLGLPGDMSANALLDAINYLGGMSLYRDALSEIRCNEQTDATPESCSSAGAEARPEPQEHTTAEKATDMSAKAADTGI